MAKGSKTTAGRFNGAQWYQHLMENRTVAALIASEEQFAIDHAKDTNEELCAYLIAATQQLGHTPHRQEVIGGTMITERFLTWEGALKAAGLSLPHELLPPWNERKIYREEAERQAELYREERKAVKAKKAARFAQRRQTREAQQEQQEQKA